MGPPQKALGLHATLPRSAAASWPRSYRTPPSGDPRTPEGEFGSALRLALCSEQAPHTAPVTVTSTQPRRLGTRTDSSISVCI